MAAFIKHAGFYVFRDRNDTFFVFVERKEMFFFRKDCPAAFVSVFLVFLVALVEKFTVLKGFYLVTLSWPVGT